MADVSTCYINMWIKEVICLTGMTLRETFISTSYRKIKKKKKRKKKTKTLIPYTGQKYPSPQSSRKDNFNVMFTIYKKFNEFQTNKGFYYSYLFILEIPQTEHCCSAYPIITQSHKAVPFLPDIVFQMIPFTFSRNNREIINHYYVAFHFSHPPSR